MKTILISGASGNLGVNLVHELHRNGYQIIALVGAQKNRDIFSALTNVKSFVVDLQAPEDVANFLQKIQNETIHAATLLVGGFTAGGFQETDVAMLDQMYRLNFLTAFNLVKPLLPRFEEQNGGQFIFIGARPVLIPDAGKNLVAYSLSKSLIFELANLVNAYGKNKHISASVLVPSTIDTPQNRQAMPDADPSTWVAPEAISQTIAFILSETGQSLTEPILKLY